MKNILKEVAYENAFPELRFFKPGSHFGRIMEVLADCEKRLETALSEEGKAIFEVFNKSQIEIQILSGIDNFIHGYQLGVLMTKEISNSTNEGEYLELLEAEF